MSHFDDETLNRFWSKVAKGGPGDCWIWTACIQNGYGYFGAKRAHRLSWEMANGPIPDGLVVCHKCDNPRCVNPDHLWVGTQAENVRDCHSKGRMPSLRPGNERGELSRFAKLKDEDVDAIRLSRLPSLEAAKKWGVSRRYVNQLRAWEARKLPTPKKPAPPLSQEDR